MGIQTYTIQCYGIEFAYSEIKHLKDHPEFKELAKDIDCDDFPSLWQEMGFINGSYYFDAKDEDQYYIIGKEIPDGSTVKTFGDDLDEEETKRELKKTCKKFRLKYSEPEIMSRVNVC